MASGNPFRSAGTYAGVVPKHSGHQCLFGGNLRFSHPRFFGGSFSGNAILKKTELSLLLNLINNIKRRQLEVKKET